MIRPLTLCVLLWGANNVLHRTVTSCNLVLERSELSDSNHRTLFMISVLVPERGKYHLNSSFIHHFDDVHFFAGE